jgi:hypothetical protein
MYHSKILNRIKLDCFFKFVFHQLNSSKMVKCEIVLLIERDNVDVVVTKSYKLLLEP